jgi:hypothetical protein
VKPPPGAESNSEDPAARMTAGAGGYGNGTVVERREYGESRSTYARGGAKGRGTFKRNGRSAGQQSVAMGDGAHTCNDLTSCGRILRSLGGRVVRNPDARLDVPMCSAPPVVASLIFCR